MLKPLENLWKDPVWSKVIATGLTTLCGLVAWFIWPNLGPKPLQPSSQVTRVVSGHVFEELSGDSVKGALVSVQGRAHSTTTDDVGNFELRIQDKELDTVRLTVAKPAYKSRDWTVRLPQDLPSSIPLQSAARD